VFAVLLPSGQVVLQVMLFDDDDGGGGMEQ